MYKLGNYNIDLTDEIGHGVFGIVYRGSHTTRQLDIAVKKCELKDGKISRDKQGELAMEEIKHLQKLKHPHIVTLYDYFFKANSFWMIMEYCDAGNLDTYVCSQNPNLCKKTDLMYQCASAVSYIHSWVNPTVHRDIKPTNILMKQAGEHTIIKIADLGLMKSVELTESVMTLMFSSHCGSPNYQAPEFFYKYEKQKFGKSVDVFSLGLVYLVMILHKRGDKALNPLTGMYGFY